MSFQPRSNYSEQAWWVAGFSEEISRKPLRRVLLERALMLYRCEDGRVVALQDRCAHRWAPLSEGRITGDDVVCPYHGFRYNPEGVCVHIPTQTHVAVNARVRAFPVIESEPFVWVWLGDPAEVGDLPATLPWARDPNWLTLKGSLPVECNYMLVQENVLDLTHFGFLHAETFQQPGWTAPPDEVTLEKGQIGYRQVFRKVKLAPFQAGPTGIGPDKEVERTDWGSFVSPAIHVAGIDIQDPAPGPGARARFSSRIVHATTPESASRTHYWWCFSQDYAVGDQELQKQVRQIVEATFAEDKHLLEIIQDTIARDREHDQGLEVSIRADRAGVQARRALEAILSKSRQGPV